jgi:hypothetical protein
VAKNPAVDPPPNPDPPSPPPVAVSVPSVDPPPPPPESPLVVAVRGAVENRPDETLKALEAFDPAAQKLLLELIPAVVQTSQFDPVKTSRTEVGVLVGQLDGLATALAPYAPLQIDKAELCRHVDGYGLFDPYATGQPLLPGSIAYLYLELRNVSCQEVAGPDGTRFRSQLRIKYRILSAADEPVDIEYKGALLPFIEVTSPRVFRSPVRGYYEAPRLPLPRKPGAYRLEITVTDTTSGRAGDRRTSLSKPFRVQ